MTRWQVRQRHAWDRKWLLVWRFTCWRVVSSTPPHSIPAKHPPNAPNAASGALCVTRSMSSGGAHSRQASFGSHRRLQPGRGYPSRQAMMAQAPLLVSTARNPMHGTVQRPNEGCG